MSLQSFVSDLLPQLTKVRMRDDLIKARERISVELMPLLKSCHEAFGKREFKAAFVTDFEKRLKPKFPMRYNGNAIDALKLGMEEVLKNCDVLEKLVEKSDERFTREAISILNVNLIQAIEGIDFIGKFALRYLNLSITAEINVIEKRSEFSGIQPAMVKWAHDNTDAFIQVFSIMCIKEADLHRKLSDVPDIVVGPESANMIEATTPEKEYDPVQFGFIPVVINPVYRLGMWIAEIQAARLSSAKAERDTVAMRLVRLEQLLSDKDDPALRREIEVYQNRLEKLEYSIKQREEEYLG